MQAAYMQPNLPIRHGIHLKRMIRQHCSPGEACVLSIQSPCQMQMQAGCRRGSMPLRPADMKCHAHAADQSRAHTSSAQHTTEDLCALSSARTFPPSSASYTLIDPASDCEGSARKQKGSESTVNAQTPCNVDIVSKKAMNCLIPSSDTSGSFASCTNKAYIWIWWSLNGTQQLQ